jgi:hypothetical protein
VTAITPARRAYLLERALMARTAEAAAIHGFVANPDARRRAEKELALFSLFRWRPRTTENLIPVSSDFLRLHRGLLVQPRALWERATASI